MHTCKFVHWTTQMQIQDMMLYISAFPTTRTHYTCLTRTCESILIMYTYTTSHTLKSRVPTGSVHVEAFNDLEVYVCQQLRSDTRRATGIDDDGHTPNPMYFLMRYRQPHVRNVTLFIFPNTQQTTNHSY